MILYYLARFAAAMLPALPLAAILRLAALGLRGRRGLHTTAWHEVGAVALILWTAALFSMTVDLGNVVQTIQSGQFYRAINVVPFVTIRQMLAMNGLERRATAVVNLLGNVAIFAPIGLLAPLLWRPFGRLLPTALVGLGLSLAIEVMQLFTYRSTDVDDLILNTLGAVAGYGLWRLLRRWVPRATARFRVEDRGGA